MKRIIDVLFAFAGLVVLSPLLLILGLLIRTCIGSPVIFRQVRPGLHGRPFTMYKLRTMTNGRDREGNMLPNEERLTKLGGILRRTSLDELPELLNVLKGDMSLVGPRPLLMEYLQLYTPEQARRHEVKPGITGWVQINGRNAINWEEKFKLDIWYVDNRSFLLDLKILWITVGKVILREGITPKGQVTMGRFEGNTSNKVSSTPGAS